MGKINEIWEGCRLCFRLAPDALVGACFCRGLHLYLRRSTFQALAVLVHSQLVSRSLVLRLFRVGQNRISAPYMTVCKVIFLLEIPYVHRIYL